MKYLLLVPILVFSKGNIYNIKVKDLKGKEINFSDYKNKILLIVNTASQCGYTPQFEGLEALHKKFQSRGLTVLGVPSNDFNQEPKKGEEIAKFCKLNYGVTFTMLSKLHVNGDKRHKLYQYLIDSSKNPKDPIKWNFEKFLVGKDGRVLGRYLSSVKPKDLEKTIESALK